MLKKDFSIFFHILVLTLAIRNCLCQDVTFKIIDEKDLKYKLTPINAVLVVAKNETVHGSLDAEIATVEVSNDNDKNSLVNFMSMTHDLVQKSARASSSSCQSGYIPDKESCTECGIQKVQPNIKIVGGVQAIQNSWPAQAYVYFEYIGKYTFPDGNTYVISMGAYCGGTVISRYTILTAAHCIFTERIYTYKNAKYSLKIYTNNLYPTRESMYRISLGINNRLDTSNQYNISKIVVHQDYNSYNLLNDIALLIINDGVSYSDYVQPACLPFYESSTFPSEYSSAYAVGWGTTDNNGSSTNYLRNVKLTIYPSNNCFLVATAAIKNWNSQICAGDLSGNKSICNGDSGGSIYTIETINGKTKYIASGIVSYGDLRGCALPNLPNVYTRVSFYINWIKENWKTSSSVSIHTLNLLFLSFIFLFLKAISLW